MRRLNEYAFSLTTAFLVLAVSAAGAEDPPATPPKPDAPERAELEKKFQESLSGATLVGRFTIVGEKDAGGGKPERYTITRLTKLKDDYWLFVARIQYGDHDVTAPLPLRVIWSGDTPVITVDQVPVPGIGSYSARVMIDNGKYAGTWSGKDHGGHLYGVLEKEAKDGAKKGAE
jgi:hypothetical protein